MTTKTSRPRRSLGIVAKAEMALRLAAAKAAEEHRASGHPLVVWKNGRVVKIPARLLARPKSRRSRTSGSR